MTHPIQNTDYIKKICITLLLIASGLSTGIFIFALPGFGHGLWPQSETPATAFHFSAALTSAALLLLSTRSSLPLKVCAHPLVLLPAALALLSLALLPFQDIPMRSFVGEVRTGEGAIWWLGIASLTASAMIVWRIKLYRRILIAIAILAFIADYTLAVSHAHMQHGFSAYFFPDYTAFNLLAITPAVAMLLAPFINIVTLGGLLYLLVNILFYLTRNKVMFAYGLVFPPLLGLWQYLPQIPQTVKKPLNIAGLAAIPLTAVALFTVLAHQGLNYYDFENTGMFRTIASRAYLMDTVFRPLIADPALLITGHGWGAFSDLLIHHLPLEWLNVTDNSVMQWDGLTTDHFHPHNMFLETLSATGLGGVALLTLYFISFYTCARSDIKTLSLITAAGLMVWASFWFLMPVNGPFLAFFAASVAATRYRLRPLRPRKHLLPLIVLAALALQLTAGALIFMTSLHNKGGHNTQSLSIENPRSFTQNCPSPVTDYKAGGLHLSFKLLQRVRYISYLADEEIEDDKKAPAEERTPEKIQAHIKEVNHLFCQTDRYMRTAPASARMEVSRLMSRSEIMLSLYPYLSPAERRYYYLEWEENLLDWLARHPTRTDLAVPYLLYHLIHTQEERSQNVINHIHRERPQDPVGLWFKGLSLLQQPQTAQRGLSMMKKALENGIERFMPVEDQLLELLSNPQIRPYSAPR